jgi:hypothetical protein
MNESESSASRHRVWIGLGLGVVFVVGLVFIVGLVAGYFYWTSPRYSLRQIKRAVEHRDVAAFEKYVDIHGVCDSAVDRLVDESLKSRGKAKTGLEAFGQSLGVGLIAMMKPMMVDRVEREVRKAVAEGRIVEPNGKAEVHIESVSREGKVAHVKLTIPGRSFDPPRPNDVRLDLRMDDAGSYWRAVGIDAVEAP